VYERFLAPLASSAATDPSSSQLWLLTLIAAAGPDGIGTDELSAITGRDPLQTQALTARSSPFLVQVEAAHAVYHPSFAEHLLAADRDPAQVGRAREAHYHLARTYIEDGDFWATITGSQRARIPWHLTQAVELTAPGPGRAKFERDTMRLAWHLFHDDGWAASATEVLGPSAPTEPYLRLQARRVLDHIDQVDPDPTAETLATRGLLIDWLDETGPSEDVIDDLQNLVEVRGRVLEHDHEDTLTARSNLASAIAASGDLPTAIAQFQELTEDRTRILGPDARDTLIARGNLALWLGRAGKTSEAIHQFRQLLAAYGALQDANISDALTARANLASLLGRTGHTHDAIDQLTELLDDHGKAFGPDHPGSFAIRNNLASCVDATGDHERSAELLSALEADTRRTLGSDHPLALTARSNLAEALGRSGQLDAAVRMFRSLGSDRARVLGPNHPDTLATSEDLAWWQDALDQRSSGDLAP
jgi:hypothetical protein